MKYKSPTVWVTARAGSRVLEINVDERWALRNAHFLWHTYELFYRNVDDRDSSIMLYRIWQLDRALRLHHSPNDNHPYVNTAFTKKGLRQ